MKLNQYIRQRRIELGFTQVELAKAVGMESGQHLCNVEKNGASFPRNKYKKLRKALQLSKDDFKKALIEDFLHRIGEYL